MKKSDYCIKCEVYKYSKINSKYYCSDKSNCPIPPPEIFCRPKKSEYGIPCSKELDVAAYLSRFRK